jgi:hypothetical protein
VEATTLDQAVDSLLAPQENSEETVEATEEPTQDVESDFEDDAVDEEVIEASDDDGETEYEDDATEYTDEVEAVDEADSDPLIDVKVNGEWQRRTLSELKQDYAGQSYIQQKMRENAEQSKQIEAAKAQLAQQSDVLNTLIQQAQNGELAPPKPPSKELLESDPIGYMQEKEAYETAMGEYNVKMQQVQQLQAQQAQQSEQQKMLHRQEQMQILQQRVPDFADPQKYEKAAQDMLKGGQEYYGVPQEALMQLTDAVEIEILYDAIRYRRLQANRKNVDQKAKKAKPMVKAGAKRVEDGQAATRRKQQAKAMKTGNIADMADLLINPKL